MSTFLVSLGPAIANHLWQSTLFAGAALLLSWKLRRYSARLRYAIWLSASMKFLIPFSVLVGLGGLLPRPQAAATGPQRAAYSTMDIVAQPFSDVASSIPVPSPAVNRVEKRNSPLPILVLTTWLCGVVMVLLIWLTRWRQVAAALQRALPVHEGREAAVLRRLCGDRHIELRLSREPMEPGVFGIFRPTLLWPEQLSERLKDEHVESIFAHELTHVRRLDNLTAALHMLVEAVFWFHPMVWWMERRMVEERERACDESVVEEGGRADIYAESLLKACRFSVESPVMCVAGISGAELSSRIRSIMTLHAQRLGGWGRTTLASLATVTLAMPMAFGIVQMIPVRGQMFHATEPLPSFEVATIKMSPGSPVSYHLTPYVLPYFNNRTAMLILRAYNVPFYDQDRYLLHGPNWIYTDRYDVQGKIDDALVAKMRTMTPWELHREQCLLMQSLLAERFKLKVHFETRVMPIYELVVAKGGPKLTPAKADAPQRDAPLMPDNATWPELKQWLPNGHMLSTAGPGGSREMVANTVTVDEMLTYLPLQPLDSATIGRNVINRTGLTGYYDISLKWTAPISDDASLPSGPAPAMPDFFTALQAQLGLKLVPSKGPVEVLVIDHIERPSEN